MGRSSALAESNAANVAPPSLPSTAFSSVPSSEEQHEFSQKTAASTSNKENEHDDLEFSPPLSIPSFPTAPTSALTPFTNPRLLLGCLSTTSNSWTAITLDLTQRRTTWGRQKDCDYIYADSLDTRIPKVGLEIYFHAPGIEALDKAEEDWTRLDGLRVIVTTQSSKGVWINGVHLLPSRQIPTRPQLQPAQPQTASPQRNSTPERTHPADESLQQPHDAPPPPAAISKRLFGELFSGDEISMGTPVVGGSASRDAKALRFMCEFFVGRGVRRRVLREGEPRFVIEEER